MSFDIDPYETLGLEPTSSDQEIRERRVALLQMLHPDRQRSDAQRRAAEAQSKRINAAFDILGKVERREAYDRSRRSSTTTARPPHPFFRPPQLDFGLLTPGARRTLILRLLNDGGPASAARVDLSVTGSWFSVDVSDAPSDDPRCVLVLTIAAYGPGGQGTLNEWVSVTLDGVTARADLRMTASAPPRSETEKRPHTVSVPPPPRSAEPRSNESRRSESRSDERRSAGVSRSTENTDRYPSIPWAVRVIVFIAIGFLGALIVFMGSRSQQPAVVASSSSTKATDATSAPPVTDRLELGKRRYLTKPFHLNLWAFGSGAGVGVDISLTSVIVQSDETVVTFHLVGDSERHSLLYEPPKPDAPRRNSFGMPIEEDYEELYIVDNFGRLLRSTSGFEGGSQSSFNNYNLIQRITIAQGEAIDLTARFPPLAESVSSISFYSPGLNGWQSQWWWKDIDLRHVTVIAEH